MDEDEEIAAARENAFDVLPQTGAVAEHMPFEPKYALIERRLREEDYLTLGSGTRFAELCEACRRGDLEQVDNLVTSFGLDVNAVDEWDYTPLILASLCGHEHVVLYLLEHGAVSDRDTFQGERCLYGALNDSIRKLLLKFDVSKAVDAAQPFAAHFASLLRMQEPATADIRFTHTLLDDPLLAHRFVLAARSSVLRKRFENAWRSKSIIALAPAIDPHAFEIVLRFLYVADISATPFSLIKPVQSAARKLELPGLLAAVSPASADLSARRRRELRNADMHTAQDDFERFVRNDVISAVRVYLQSDYQADKDACACVPPESTADILLAVNDRQSVFLYPTHRAVLIRSEYFLTMFTSLFSEGIYCTPNTSASSPISTPSTSGLRQLPVISLNASCDVAEIILTYLYADRVDIPGSIALDVLYCADELLIDKLKSLASVVLSSNDEILPADIYDILRAGWATRMDRLERFAAKYFANNLSSFIVQPDFADIVAESARRIRFRDETDTIEIIDDIRFYLTQKFGIIFEEDMDPVTGKIQENPWRKITMYEHQYNAELDLIDGLLERLDLDA
ncbi:uncharacterized protein V2V93DRAFT_374895 [Kockiozyma suomiensis]|uniref:uncharacterized protein n=1 Tax=Kockiozyma suomiensis TaxID=1337062 RepID=UPI0033440626